MLLEITLARGAATFGYCDWNLQDYQEKGLTVAKALSDNFWVSQIKFTKGISASHIQEFATLWEKLQGVVLDHNTQDTITWKFMNNRSFSTSSAYKIQFEGCTITPLLKTVWKVWATPKSKLFPWLIIHK
ncbi:ribonuclease h protein [Hordeum vulgare]|nr:ribonuclease h protein [Hordeum vulgare]